MDFEYKMVIVTRKDLGLSQIPSGTKTVLGLGPAPNNLIDQVTGDLPLL